MVDFARKQNSLVINEEKWMREGGGRPSSKPAISPQPWGRLFRLPMSMLQWGTLALSKISCLYVKKSGCKDWVKPRSLGSLAEELVSLDQAW